MLFGELWSRDGNSPTWISLSKANSLSNHRLPFTGMSYIHPNARHLEYVETSSIFLIVHFLLIPEESSHLKNRKCMLQWFNTEVHFQSAKRLFQINHNLFVQNLYHLHDLDSHLRIHGYPLWMEMIWNLMARFSLLSYIYIYIPPEWSFEKKKKNDWMFKQQLREIIRNISKHTLQSSVLHLHNI